MGKHHKGFLKKLPSDTDSICPFVMKPSKECYCVKMDSQKIIFAAYYCIEHYEECNIYKELKGKQVGALNTRDTHQRKKEKSMGDTEN